jgi:monoamine oxidase
MARTPLLSALQRSFRLARGSLRTGLDPFELRDREAARLRSRREFLATGAAAAASISLARCASLPAAPRGDARVIVVGAGIAGLTCAYRLRQAGIPVRVFEAQNRIGGRMFSLRGHFDDGQIAELGGELVDTGHVHLRRLAKHLHLPLDDLTADVPAEPAVWFFGGRRRPEREVIEAFLPVAARVESSLAMMGKGNVTYRSTGPALELDRLTVAEWLDGDEFSRWLRDMLDVGFTTEFGLEIGRQSALNFITTISPDTRTFEMYGMSDERFHIRGGNDLVPKTLASRLEGAIELNSSLERIRRRADGLLECSLRQGAQSLTAAADHVVVTVPFTVLREVTIDADLTPAKRRAIAELGYGTNAKLMIGFSSRTWRTRYASSGSTLTDLPYQLTWDTSRHQAGTAGILTNFTGGRHGVELGAGAAGDHAAAVAAQLDQVYPGLAAARTKESRFHWPSFAHTRGSYACYLPGQWTSIRGAEGEPAGNLHFAGEHCSLEAQGFMEGGCETGERAAAEVLAALRRPGAARVA